MGRNESVARFYDQNPENEWMRLFRSPYRRLEFEVVHHFLTHYITKPSHIVDLGGGPGRYALALAKMGHRVTLIDLSQGNLALARRKIAGAGLHHAIDIVWGDDQALTGFEGGVFDAVLCMGPLYHLHHARERHRCLEQCLRVLKPGGPLFVTAYPRLSFLRDMVRAGQFASSYHHNPSEFDAVMRQGYSEAFSLAKTYFCHVDELRSWLTACHLEGIEIASTHGFVSFMDEQVNAIAADPEAWNVLIHWVLETCRDPHALAMAEYWLAVGRKT
ncbi:MAG: class I SAM-dependent methyltransferase [bacterium]|jgi:ubiquinone/menaquinone biosynthesis C-methylase UbiE|nr:class I SAM-dependent methyltransferase [bacterium]